MNKHRILLIALLLMLVSIMPAAAQDTLAEKQVVNAVVESKVSVINPGSVGGGQRDWTRVTFAAPFVLSPEGEMIPWLATGYTVSDDGLEYTLTLNPDAAFSDGTPITASDLKKSWEWGMKAANVPSWGGLLTIFTPIVGMTDVNSGAAEEASGLTVVDDHTLKITLDHPVIGFQAVLASYLTGVIKTSDDVDNPDYWRKPTTAGPYTITWDPDTGEVTLEKSEHWWGTPVTIDEIHYHLIADPQTKLIAYENGEVDLFKDTGTLLDQLAQTHKDEMTSIPGLGFFFLEVSNTVEPTSDVHIRRALLYSIDHDKIIHALFPNHPVADTIVQNSTVCYNPDLKSPYDLDLAKQELAQSVYGSADKVPPVQLYFYTSIDFWGRIVAAYQQQWKENLGIDVQLNGVDTYDGTVGNIYRFSGGPTINDPSDILTKFASDGIEGAYAAQAGYKPPAELSALMDEANALPADAPNRCDLYQQIEKALVVDEAAVWPQIGVPYNWVVKPYLKGFQTSLNQDINWEAMSVLAH